MGVVVWYSGDLRTGRIFTQLYPDSVSHTRVMDDSGALQGSVTLSAPDVYALNLASATAPCKTFLACAYQDNQGNETFLQGGPVWTHTYDGTTAKLTIGAAGLWSYFDHRKVIQVLGALNPATVAATYSGMSLGTIAKRLIQLAATHTGGSLPIVLPADQVEPADDAHTRTYNGYDLAWVGDELRKLSQVQNGPEIQFRPRRAADARFVEWVMVTGTETAPLVTQTGSDWVLDSTLPNSSVGAVSLALDGSAMGDEGWARGNGSEQATIIGHYLGTTLTGNGYPLLEVEVTGTLSDELLATVNAHAQAAVAQSGRPALTISVKVQQDGPPTIAQVNVGDYVRLVVMPGHPYLQQGGSFRSRIVQLSGDSTDQATWQLAPIPGVF